MSLQSVDSLSERSSWSCFKYSCGISEGRSVSLLMLVISDLLSRASVGIDWCSSWSCCRYELMFFQSFSILCMSMSWVADFMSLMFCSLGRSWIECSSGSYLPSKIAWIESRLKRSSDFEKGGISELISCTLCLVADWIIEISWWWMLNCSMTFAIWSFEAVFWFKLSIISTILEQVGCRVVDKIKFGCWAQDAK